MWKCERCGCLCDEDDLDVETWDEHHPYGEGYAVERWSEQRCPECGSSMVFEVDGITVLIKQPGRRALEDTIENSLGALKEIVGGKNIEVLDMPGGAVAIFDADGAEKDKAMNMTVQGHMIVGTIVFAGVDGDEFTDVPDELYKQIVEVGPYG